MTENTLRPAPPPVPPVERDSRITLTLSLSPNVMQSMAHMENRKRQRLGLQPLDDERAAAEFYCTQYLIDHIIEIDTARFFGLMKVSDR